MFIRKLQNCTECIAGDSTILRELLHPDKDDVHIRYSLAHATVQPGQRSLRHKLKVSEVYFILQGEGVMHIDDEKRNVSADQVISIPPNATQYIENIGQADLQFLCIVDPAWHPQDEEVVSS